MRNGRERLCYAQLGRRGLRLSDSCNWLVRRWNKLLYRRVECGMDERIRRVEQIEQRVQMLLGIYGVLPLEFKPAYSVGDLLLQHLDGLQQEAGGERWRPATPCRSFRQGLQGHDATGGLILQFPVPFIPHLCQSSDRVCFVQLDNHPPISLR